MAALAVLLTATGGTTGCQNAQFGGQATNKKAEPPVAAAAANPQGSPNAEPVPTNNTDASSNGNPPSTTTASTQSQTQSQTGVQSLFNTISQVINSSTQSHSGAQANTTTQSGGVVPPNMQLCSQSYYVPATANPYLAGVASGTTLTYTLNSGDPQTPTDTVAGEAPVLVAPTNTACIQAGASLYFSVYGGIAHTHAESEQSADGEMDMIVSHQLGAVSGISDIRAPIDSLIGVFLGDGDPSSAAPPPALDFSTPSQRDYTSLSPLVGQIFFIGTGRTSNGQYHQVIVPHGATRLFFAAMDEYQWNNNVGGVHGAIMTAKTP